MSAEAAVRRAPYEVEYCLAASGEGWRKVTSYPVDIEKTVGTGNSWALVKTDGAEWDGSTGCWVTISEAGEGA